MDTLYTSRELVQDRAGTYSWTSNHSAHSWDIQTMGPERVGEYESQGHQSPASLASIQARPRVCSQHRPPGTGFPSQHELVDRVPTWLWSRLQDFHMSAFPSPCSHSAGQPSGRASTDPLLAPTARLVAVIREGGQCACI